MNSLRSWSLVLGAASIAPLGYLLYENWLASQLAQQQASEGRYMCGTGMFAIFALCVVLALLLSLIASALSLAGYLRTEKPRPKRRLLEIMLAGNVIVLALSAGLISVIALIIKN